MGMFKTNSNNKLGREPIINAGKGDTKAIYEKNVLIEMLYKFQLKIALSARYINAEYFLIGKWLILQLLKN